MAHFQKVQLQKCLLNHLKCQYINIWKVSYKPKSDDQKCKHITYKMNMILIGKCQTKIVHNLHFLSNNYYCIKMLPTCEIDILHTNDVPMHKYYHWRQSGVKSTSATSGIWGWFFGAPNICTDLCTDFRGGAKKQPVPFPVALVRMAPLIIVIIIVMIIDIQMVIEVEHSTMVPFF